MLEKNIMIEYYQHIQGKNIFQIKDNEALMVQPSEPVTAPVHAK